MITSTFGITQEPFNTRDCELMPHQRDIFQFITIHAQQGGFCVVVGDPGVGKSILRQHIETLDRQPEHVIISISRTMHTYINVLKQLAESLKIEASIQKLEHAIIQAAYDAVRDRKTLYTLIDEAHLLDMVVLRKLRLLFDRFPRHHNLVLFGERTLMHRLSMTHYEDIKHRITYSAIMPGLSNDALEDYIHQQLEKAKLGANTYDSNALDLIVRSAQGNLRLCRNLAHGSLLEACRLGKKMVTLSHVNAVLVQPHWRSHEELLQQQAAGQ